MRDNSRRASLGVASLDLGPPGHVGSSSSSPPFGELDGGCFAFSDEDFAAWMDDCSVENLRRRLQDQGHHFGATARIVAARTGSNLNGHRRIWCRFWRPWAKINGITDPWDYDLHSGCACLDEVQTRTELWAPANGKKVQHCVAKDARAAINLMWGIAQDGSNFTEEWAVKQIFVGLRITAPLQAAYSDTWDGSLIFSTIFRMAKDGVLIVDMKHHEMRPWVETLLKLKHGARSGDLAPTKDDHGGLYRHYWPQDGKAHLKQGLRGDWLADDVTGVRWFKNKTIGQRHSDYSVWHHQGDFLQNSEGFPYMEAACPRRILNKYLEITDTLPRHDDLVFLASKRSKDKDGRPAFKGIGSQTVAHDVGAVMTLCGVPARFKPHSTRHVKLSTEREIARAAGKGIDDALGKVDVSKKVFDLFYNQPFSTDTLKTTDTLTASRRARPALLADWAALSGRSITDPSPPSAPSSVAAGIAANVTSDSEEYEEREYNVDKVISRRTDHGITSYLIRWQGFTAADDTWEPELHLNCPDAIRHFKVNEEAASALANQRLALLAPARAPAKQGTSRASGSSNVVAVYAARSARARRAPASFQAGASHYGDCALATSAILQAVPTPGAATGGLDMGSKVLKKNVSSVGWTAGSTTASSRHIVTTNAFQPAAKPAAKIAAKQRSKPAAKPAAKKAAKKASKPAAKSAATGHANPVVRTSRVRKAPGFFEGAASYRGDCALATSAVLQAAKVRGITDLSVMNAAHSAAIEPGEFPLRPLGFPAKKAATPAPTPAANTAAEPAARPSRARSAPGYFEGAASVRYDCVLATSAVLQSADAHHSAARPAVLTKKKRRKKDKNLLTSRAKGAAAQPCLRGSRFAQCPVCQVSVAIKLMGHHLDSDECTGSHPVP